jgi:DNA-directed RNA polymerase specialized sigma24 family protein
VAAGPDQRGVGLRDEELLRRFVTCREAGDGDGARHWWVRLVEANFDRVRGLVDLRAGRYGLSADEREEAVQLALVKLWRNMVRTFKGTSMGEWVNSTKQLVEFACQEVQRRAARRTEHETSFDAGAADPELANPGWKGDELAQQRHRRDEEQQDASSFVGWALPQLGNDRRRLVVERTLDGVPAEDIAGELDVSIANLYALRSRGLKDLAKLRDRYDA